MALLLRLTFIMLSSRAETLAGYYLTKIAQARSAEQTIEIKETYDQWRVVRTACRIQLREKLVPLACYEWLHLSPAQPFDDSPRVELAELDRLCATASEELRFESAGGQFVSPSCAGRVREARAIQAYREEETRDWSEN